MAQVGYNAEMNMENYDKGKSEEVWPDTDLSESIKVVFALNGGSYGGDEREKKLEVLNHDFGEYGLEICPVAEGGRDSVGVRILSVENFIDYLKMYKNSRRELAQISEYYRVLSMVNEYYENNPEDQEDFIIAMRASSSFLQGMLSDISAMLSTEGGSRMSVLREGRDLFTELSKI